MSRQVVSWHGKTDDSQVPPRVRLRVFERGFGHCHKCGVRILAGMKWECDHIIALVNGGQHCESNLQCLCSGCHKGKSKKDVAEKAKVYRIRAKHVGIRRRKRTIGGRRFDGSPIFPRWR